MASRKMKAYGYLTEAGFVVLIDSQVSPVARNPDIDYNDSVSKQNQTASKYTVCLANPPFKGTIDAESINDNLKAVTNTKKQNYYSWLCLIEAALLAPFALHNASAG